LAIIIDWAFDYMQLDGGARADLADWPREVSGGSVYLRLSTRGIDQPPRVMDASLAEDIIRGAYWLKAPDPSCEVIIAYQGVLASEAIAAAGIIGGDSRNVAVLAITSADRLNAGWHAAQRARQHGGFDATCHIETLLGQAPRNCGLVTAIDAHPVTLGWLGSVLGHRTIALGVEHFGQTGTVDDLYAHFGIGAAAIAKAARSFAARR
jgi:pyruvate dehydrogenase E1 component